MDTISTERPHWSARSTDPNTRELRYERLRRVRNVQRESVTTRSELVREVCLGKRVLDLGCVDQVPDGVEIAPLHREVVSIAASCVGVDTNERGVAALEAEGYDVVCCDATGPELLSTVSGPFDVVVAGELIEHVLNPGGLLHNARELLAPGGVLLITTPNPDSMVGAAIGVLGRYTTNLDHVADFQPYHVAELADRTGFELSSWCGERAHARGKRIPLHILARLVRAFDRHSTADCYSNIYLLTKRP
jgi:2-polyprenyl-3-methyl-5-hydroxy-6-metoxy-1,4-benzoquinol methylase